MKRKNLSLSRKLFLNKATLAILNQAGQQSIKGGDYYPGPVVNQPPSRAQGYDCCIIATYGGPGCLTGLNECLTGLVDCTIEPV
jgi:hypothetical protein